MQLAAEHEKAMLTKIRQSQGIIETKEDRERDKERKRVADKFEDMRKERHWSEKKRSEMTERDWRIFREDFNIAYKVCTTCVYLQRAQTQLKHSEAESPLTWQAIEC